MAIYRSLQLSFWTDNKVEDEFTPEDKYFYLYLLTNPQTNICGCYEVSYKQMTHQTGYNQDTIDRLIKRFETVHNVIRYCNETKEILILNWYKYNWNKSKDTLKGVLKVAEYIKCEAFRKYVTDMAYCIENDTPIRGSTDPLQASVSVSDYIINNINNNKKRNTYKDILNKLLTEFSMSDSLLESVNDWIGYKSERNFSYKERGLKTLLKTVTEKANQYGDEAVKNLIEESIANGYQGIVWDKLEKTKSRNDKKEVNNTYESESSLKLW